MSEHDECSRREFLGKTGIAAGLAAGLASRPASAAEAAAVPRRLLGRTGASVSILAFGCGSRFLQYPEDQASAVLERALGLGINYFDTAVGYGEGESERRVGRVMATHRKDVFLATKVPQRARTREAALREVEASLKRLQTDHLDLLHLHSLGGEDDLAKIEAPDGAIKALLELREQKVTRFIGITSHSNGAVLAKAIERHDLDCTQMAMNPARANRFEELALPAANKKRMGVILMKVMAQEKLLGPDGARAETLLRYGWSLPVSAVVCGMPKLAHLDENVASARGFKPMAPPEMDRLRDQLANHQVALAQFFIGHHDTA